MSMSNYLEEKVIDHVLRQTSYTMPSNVYVALCTASVSESATGSTITEPSGNGYARVEVTDFTDPSSGTQGETDNGSTIEFTADGGNWGDITHVAVCDASSSGNVLFYGALESSITVNDTETLRFQTGTLNVSIN